jgi:tetratricopeptide (TPR) repeat protein
LIESCLALKAEDRPKGAAELAAALRRELSFPRRLRRWTATHRWRVATAAALLAASLLAGTVALALRPPYAVRQFRSGLAYLEQGRDDLAIQCLNASLEADPARPETLLARARAYEHQGDYWTAFHDYSAAAELAPSPSVDAHMGYCMGRLGDHEVACARYLSAVKAGCDSPAVLNDLASSLICLGKFDDAEGYLRRAIERDDRLQPAYYNLATVLFQRALKNGQQPPPEALAAATRAADLGPQSGELCCDIADMQMLAAQGDPAMVRCGRHWRMSERQSRWG